MASLTCCRRLKSALLPTTGLLLSTAVLATGCGGGGSDTMRATLTDAGCTYEGDTTPAPGLFNIEVENKTSHFAIFNLWALAAGKNVEDVRHAFEQARPAFEQGKEPKPGTFDGLFEQGGANTATDPEATSVLPVNASSGRFVIACFVHTSVDARLQSEHLPPPAAVHVVPVELDVR
jgi:hypothetical protein